MMCARLAFVRFCVMASMRVSPARVAKAERMLAAERRIWRTKLACVVTEIMLEKL